MIYEWDTNTADENLKRHKVSFDEATSVFTDPFALTFDDPETVAPLGEPSSGQKQRARCAIRSCVLLVALMSGTVALIPGHHNQVRRMKAFLESTERVLADAPRVVVNGARRDHEAPRLKRDR